MLLFWHGGIPCVEKKIVASFEIIIMHLRQISYHPVCFFLPMPIPLSSGEFCFSLWMTVGLFFLQLWS
jgi:hypothetical protein